MGKFFWRSNLSQQIWNSIKNSSYELPLKKSEIETIIDKAKIYVKEHINFNESDYDYFKDRDSRNEYREMSRQERYILISKREEEKGKSIKAKMISTILDDFYTCSKNTQELIALGIVGLMNVEEKYINMYNNHEWVEKRKYDEDEVENFGWEDGVYLSTGDDWDWSPDKEQELEECACWDGYYPEYEEEEEEFKYYLDSEINKYDSIYSSTNYFDEIEECSLWIRNSIKNKNFKPEYKHKAEAFYKLSNSIEKEFTSINRYNNSKELKHNKMIISLYKKLQKEIYKQELRELIRADIYFCNDYTVDIIKDVTYLYCKDFFELECDNFYDVLKQIEQEFELYKKEKMDYEK